MMSSLAKRKTRLNEKTNRWGMLLLLPFFLPFVLFGLFPILHSFYLSFMTYDGINPMRFNGLANYDWVLFGEGSRGFWVSLRNVVIIMLIKIPVGILLSLSIALALFSKKMRLNRTLQVMCFMPSITTSVAVGIIFALLFDYKLGGVNSLLLGWGFIEENINWLGNAGTSRFVLISMIIWQGMGFTALLFLGGLVSVSDEVVDACIVDGANTWQRVVFVLVPMLRNVMIFVVVTSIIGGFQIMEEPMMLYSSWAVTNTIDWGGSNNFALTPVWMLYNIAYSATKFGRGAALAFSLAVVIGIFSYINFRILQNSNKETRSDD